MSLSGQCCFVLLPPRPRQLGKGVSPPRGIKGNHNTVTPHCAIKNHPPGKKNQLQGLGGLRGLERDRGTFIWQESIPHQDHCDTQSLVFWKGRRGKSQEPPNYMEEKEPPFSQSLVFGSGHMTERENVAK